MTVVTTSPVTLRYGAVTDQVLVAGLHDRCSDETRRRRFHAPLPRTPDSLVRRTLEPENGWSVLAELDGEVIGMACVGPVSTCDLEVGILVEDAHQGRGIGTLLLTDIAIEAGTRGYRTLLCLTQPDNHAVIGTVARSGLRWTVTEHDALMGLVMDLPAASLELPRPA
jgi:GNAT superfamily N-acetyltransferase